MWILIVALCLVSATAGFVAGFTHGWYSGGEDCKLHPEDWVEGGSKGR